MAKYWKKELPEIPLRLPIGKAVPFEYTNPQGYGYLATDDGWLIGELYKAIERRIGGVSEITQEEYEGWQKKRLASNELTLRGRQLRQRGSIGPKSRNTQRQVVAAPAVTNVFMGMTNSGEPVTSMAQQQRPEGLKIEREFVKPRIGRIPDNM